MVATAAAIALVATACGDGGDDGTEATTTEPAPELTGEPVVLGVIAELTEGIASPELPSGAMAAAEAVNRAGGIDGRPVEVVECDTRNDPNTAAECGRTMVDEGVAAVVGSISVHSSEYMPLFVEEQIPALGIVVAGSPGFLSEASYPIAGGAPISIGGLAAGLAQDGATNIAMARIDVAQGAALAGFANEALASEGLEITNDVPVREGAADVAPQVTAALEGGTDAVIVALSGQDAINFVVALRQQAPEIPIALVSSEQGDVVDALGDDVDDVYLQSGYFPPSVENAATEQFVADVEAAGFDDTSRFVANSYASVLVFREIASTLPELTAPALWAALPTTTGVDIGLLPPLQFQEGGVAGIPRLFNPCVFLTRLEGGEQVPVSGEFLDPFGEETCDASGEAVLPDGD